MSLTPSRVTCSCVALIAASPREAGLPGSVSALGSSLRRRSASVHRAARIAGIELLRDKVEQPVADLALRHERPRVHGSVAAEDCDPVRVGAEARTLLGDVVRNEEVERLPAELLGGAL